MPLPSVLLPPIEAAVNQVIQLDPVVAEAVAELSPKTAAIQVQGLSWTIYACPHAKGVMLMSQYDGEVAAHFTAPPLTLLRFVKEQDRALLDNGDIQTEGDPEAVEAFARLVLMLDIDWQGVMAGVFGELPASFLGSGLRVLRDQLQHALQSVRPDLDREEQAMLVTRQAFQHFGEELSDLRQAVDDLEARVARLG